MRNASEHRQTKETDIELTLEVDGRGACDVESGVGFFDHMLAAFARHGHFDISGTVHGDLQVDAHHTVEDAGIVLGRLLDRALGDKRGIRRFGSVILPMDEACVLAAVDISGRGQLHWALDVPPCMLGAFDSSLTKEFFIAFATNAGLTLHVRGLSGENAHHIVECCFKAVARALSQACEDDPRAQGQLPSTKGLL